MFMKIEVDTDLKIILLDYKNFVKNYNRKSNVAKNVDILATSLNILCNYFDIPTKLFSDLLSN